MFRKIFGQYFLAATAAVIEASLKIAGIEKSEYLPEEVKLSAGVKLPHFDQLHVSWSLEVAGRKAQVNPTYITLYVRDRIGGYLTSVRLSEDQETYLRSLYKAVEIELPEELVKLPWAPFTIVDYIDSGAWVETASLLMFKSEAQAVWSAYSKEVEQLLGL